VPVKLDPNDRRFVVFNRQDTLVRRDLIDRKEALARAGHPEEFERLLG